MKIGIKSTAYFGLEDFENGLKTLKEHGYDAVDYQEFSNMKSPLYSMDDEEFANFLARVSECARENDVEIYQLHAIWPTAGDDTPEGIARSLEYFNRSILGARLLGCKRVVVHPRLPYGWGGGGTEEEYFQANVDLMKSLMPAAVENDVTVCLENMPFKKGEVFSTMREWLAVLDAVNHPRAKACLDTGHLNVMAEEPYAAVQALAKYLEAMHVHDNRWSLDMHLIPYQGTLDWNALIRGLQSIGFQGCVSLETCIAPSTPVAGKEPLQIALAKLARNIAEQIDGGCEK